MEIPPFTNCITERALKCFAKESFLLNKKIVFLINQVLITVTVQQAISPAFFLAERRLYAPFKTIFVLLILNPEGSLISE